MPIKFEKIEYYPFEFALRRRLEGANMPIPKIKPENKLIIRQALIYMLDELDKL